MQPSSLTASPPASPARESLVHAALLLVLLGALFPGVWLRGEVIAPGDVLYAAPPWSAHAPEGFARPGNPQAVDPVAAFLPWYALSTEALRAGRLPLWNPLGFGGMPLMANYQSAVCYPPRLLHLAFGLAWGTTLLVLVKLWWCGMTAWWCGRGLGLPRGATAFLSVGWMLCGYNATWCQWPLADVAGWVPLLFLGVEWGIAGRRRAAFLLLSASGGLALLAGHPETAFAIAGPLALYTLLRLVVARTPWRQAAGLAGVCAAALCLALAIAAVQVLPFLEYVTQSAHFLDRPGMDRDYTLPFSALAGFVVPRFFGSAVDGNYWGDLDSSVYGMFYPGLAAWAGVLLLGVARRGLDRTARHRAWALAAAAVLCTGLAWGLPPFSWVSRLPLYNTTLRCHHLVFLGFALPLLGAMGLAARDRVTGRAWAWVLLPAGLAALALWGAYGFHEGLIETLGMPGFVGRQLAVAGGLGATALACCIPRGRRPALLLTVLLAADLLYAARGLNPTMPPGQLYPPTELTGALRAIVPPPRVCTASAGIPAGVTIPYGIEQWGAYDGLYPGRMMTFQRTLGEDIWNAMEPVCGIGYYVHDPARPPAFPLEEPGRFERVATLDGLELFRNTRAWGRAALVGGLEFVEDEAALFARMKEPGYDPAWTVLAQPSPALAAVPKVLRGSGAGSPGQARVVSRAAEKVVVAYEASRAAVLVLNDTFYPGWRAHIDGEEVPIFPAWHAFRGVVVPEGRHTVVLAYRPASVAWGAGVTLAALVVLGLAGLSARRGIRVFLPYRLFRLFS